MVESDVLNPHPPEFERFLYASVGEDRNGYVVTVLSALARLGLDPWKEAAELVALVRDAAQARLETRLARFRDVPALASDHGRVAISTRRQDSKAVTAYWLGRPQCTRKRLSRR